MPIHTKWISVKFRLPEIGEEVEVLRGGGGAYYARYAGNHGEFDQGGGIGFLDVTHWAPLPPKEPVADGWISVEERLPEDRMHYLVACAWNGIRWVTKLLWDGYRFHIKQANSIVTHWQPLPELPEPAEPPEPAESPPAFFIGAPREDSTYRGVYHITGRWVEGFSDEGEAIRLRDRLNKLWLQDKGSTKETP